jgi:hypothetical protein
VLAEETAESQPKRRSRAERDRAVRETLGKLGDDRPSDVVPKLEHVRVPGALRRERLLVISVEDGGQLVEMKLHGVDLGVGRDLGVRAGQEFAELGPECG